MVERWNGNFKKKMINQKMRNTNRWNERCEGLK
jgi:hypothetical protein